jgi:hypothetical protein
VEFSNQSKLTLLALGRKGIDYVPSFKPITALLLNLEVGNQKFEL